ncbi:hypothetical protein J7643_10915 [bacterium]|nr:hypothetical protein [bacterium]
MRTSIITLSVLIGLLGSQAASAAPHKGRLSITPFVPLYTGGEALLPIAESPLTIGVNGLYVFQNHAQYTAWAQLSQPLSESTSLGLILGLNHTWDMTSTATVAGSTSPGLAPGPLGYTVGLSLQHQWGSVRVQATPNYTLIPRWMDYLSLREAIISGLPWLEIGYQITPAFEVSISASMLPLKASWLF